MAKLVEKAIHIRKGGSLFKCLFTLQEERVLFHYNGHGVPRATANGEIWVFNKVSIVQCVFSLILTG